MAPVPPSPDLPKARARRRALLAAFAYLAFGAAWIYASDAVIARLAGSMALANQLQTAKGLAFIVATAIAIYFLARHPVQADEHPRLPDAHGLRPRLRVQLVLLAGALMLPLVALLAHNVWREAHSDQSAAGESAALQARLAAADIAAVLRDVRLSAAQLALRPGVRALDPARCDPLLLELPGLLPHVSNAYTIAASGDFACLAAGALPRRVSTAGRADLMRMLTAGSAMTGTVYRGPDTARWSVPVGDVLRDAQGTVAGAVVLALDLARLAPDVASNVPGGHVLLVDGQGRQLLRAPDDGRAGEAPADVALVQAAVAGTQGHLRVAGHDGADRIVGYSRVADADWTVIAVLPAEQALATSRLAAARNVASGVLLVLAGMLVAWLLSRRIERPMRAIALTARSVADGDTLARAPVAGSAETAEIAAQLNALLDRLPRIEAQLREREQQLDLLLRGANEGVLVYAPDERITFANDAAARLFGLPDRSHLVGRHAPDVLPVELQAEAPRRLDDRRAGRGERYEVHATGHDGVRRWLYVSVAPQAGQDGALEGVLALMHDITERREVEERLARVTRLYWALSEINEAVLRTTDPDTLFKETCRIVAAEGGFVSAAVFMLDPDRTRLVPVATAGAARGAFGGAPIVLGHAAASTPAPLAEALRAAQPRVVGDVLAVSAERAVQDEARALGVRASGAFPIRRGGVVAGLLAVHAGEVDYFDIGLTELIRQIADDVSFALDVYDRAGARDRAEAEVRELNAELERRVAERTARLTAANQELESFSYSVSHDLRAPVRAINGFAQILAEHGREQLDDEGMRLLANIIRSSSHMGRLIDDLLGFAQLGRSAVELRPVSLPEAVERALAELRPAVAARGARVSVPPTGPAVRGDPTLVHQVVLNLLANAIEYRREGSAPEVRVDWRRDGADVELVVADDGIGIAPEHHAKIFDVFVRLHSQAAHPGTGVGLALVAKAVHLMGGSIRVDSQEGEGAAFHVRLPAA